MYIVVIRLDLRHIFFSSCYFVHSIEATHRSFSFALSAHCFDMCSSSSLFFSRCCCHRLYRILFRSVRFSRERLVVRCHYLNDILSLCAWKHNSTRRWLYLLCSTCSSVAALFFRFKTTCVWPPNSSEEQVRNSSCYFTFCDNNVFFAMDLSRKNGQMALALAAEPKWNGGCSSRFPSVSMIPFIISSLLRNKNLFSMNEMCAQPFMPRAIIYVCRSGTTQLMFFFRHRLHIFLLLLSICLLTQ